MVQLAKIFIESLICISLLEITAYFISDVITYNVCGQINFHRAVVRMPQNITKTVIFKLPVIFAKLVAALPKLILKLTLCIVDGFIELLWSMIPFLKRIVRAPKLSKLIKL